MTLSEFFKADQEQWFMEWVESEPTEIGVNTNPHTEKITFADVPF